MMSCGHYPQASLRPAEYAHGPLTLAPKPGRAQRRPLRGQGKRLRAGACTQAGAERSAAPGLCTMPAPHFQDRLGAIGRPVA